ncbi:hypothetical protein [Lamprocystis purpurea]|jgi:hypothetical protein|uniref:hypothetical protein n=1 Tax=Lamprocystis purpurea TaxID=61598 RepID=UPI0012FC3376|nr:hypothetical protein [Lamprocystis purpurea]
MSTSTDLRDVAKRRETECRIEAEAFDLWLSFLDKTNWITDILPAILSTVAGAAIFGLFLPQWDIWAGMAAFLSSALIVIHKMRNCDAHQAECKRLIRAYRGLATKYRTFHEIDVDNPDQHFSMLETIIATISETADARIPEKYRQKAKERVIGKEAYPEKTA